MSPQKEENETVTWVWHSDRWTLVEDLYGGFHSHGGTPKWMVYSGKSQCKMDDEQGYQKPPYMMNVALFSSTSSTWHPRSGTRLAQLAIRRLERLLSQTWAPVEHYLGDSIVMGLPKNGWLISWEIPWKWMMNRGTPILGNLSLSRTSLFSWLFLVFYYKNVAGYTPQVRAPAALHHR